MVDARAAQRDDPLAFAVLVDSACRAGVAAGIEGLELGDESQGVRGRTARDRGRGAQGGYGSRPEASSESATSHRS